MRILLTEDNFIVGKSIKQILENYNHLPSIPTKFF